MQATNNFSIISALKILSAIFEMKNIKSIKAFLPGINLNVYHNSQLKIKVQNKKDRIADLFQEFPFTKVWKHIYLSDFVFLAAC